MLKAMFLLITALLLFACTTAPKAPAKPPVNQEKVIAEAHQANLEKSTLVTGWYHVLEYRNGFPRTMRDYPDTLYIDPKPIITKAHIKDVSISTSDYGEKNISLEFEETGAKAWANATEKAIDKKVACIIDNVLIMAPVIRDKITGGKAMISGRDFSEEDLKSMLKTLR